MTKRKPVGDAKFLVVRNVFQEVKMCAGNVDLVTGWIRRNNATIQSYG
jgi:hypothetical protein